MKTIWNKIFIVFLPTLLILVPAGRAQNTKQQYADTLTKLRSATPEKRAQMLTDMMKTKLALNDAQVRQVSAINLAYALKMEPIIKSDDSKFSKYCKVRPLLAEKDEKLKGAMTADQFAKYQDIKQQMMDQAKKTMNI